jgi:hypothetical protein
MFQYKEPLLFYDGLQIFIAEDQFYSKYICTLVDQSEEKDIYLCVPISPSRLSAIMHGTIELREIYTNTESNELFTVEAQTDLLRDLPASPMSPQELPANWLPETGFFLNIERSDNLVIAESVERQRAIIHCHLNPPEAQSEAKILADNLSQATKLVQRLIKYAFRRSLTSLEKNLRDQLSTPDNYQLEVFAFSRGSFTLHLQSALPADLVGYVEITKALQIIDRVTSLVATPNATVEQVAQLGGHFATAYKDLLKFISDVDTPFEYEWSTPETRRSVHRRISSSQAKPLYDALVERTDIGSESIVLIGKLTKVDEKLKTWRIINEEDDKEYNGESETELAGLIIETQRYKFVCEERLEEERGTGKEFSKLYLISLQTI